MVLSSSVSIWGRVAEKSQNNPVQPQAFRASFRKHIDQFCTIPTQVRSHDKQNLELVLVDSNVQFMLPVCIGVAYQSRGSNSIVGNMDQT